MRGTDFVVYVSAVYDLMCWRIGLWAVIVGVEGFEYVAKNGVKSWKLVIMKLGTSCGSRRRRRQ